MCGRLSALSTGSTSRPMRARACASLPILRSSSVLLRSTVKGDCESRKFHSRETARSARRNDPGDAAFNIHKFLHQASHRTMVYAAEGVRVELPYVTDCVPNGRGERADTHVHTRHPRPDRTLTPAAPCAVPAGPRAPAAPTVLGFLSRADSLCERLNNFDRSGSTTRRARSPSPAPLSLLLTVTAELHLSPPSHRPSPPRLSYSRTGRTGGRRRRRRATRRRDRILRSRAR